MGRKKSKSKESIYRMAKILEKIDDLGLDVDEFRQKPDKEIKQLWKLTYKSNLKDSTVKGYKRVADQLADNYKNRIKNENNKITNLDDKRDDINTELRYAILTTTEKKKLTKQINKTDKQIAISERKIQKYKSDDIKQRKKTLKVAGKSIDGQMMNFKAQIVKNRLRLRVQRVKMSNEIFEDIVNGLILTYKMDRRDALEHARLIAKIPKDKLGQEDSDYITPKGLKIPHKEIDYYRKNSPSVLSY